MVAADLIRATRVSRGDTGRPSLQVLVIALLLAMMLPTAMLSMTSAVVVDSGRDLANAWTIANAADRPLAGPEIFGTWALGPAWFYLLALPIALGGSLSFVAACVGLLAALKIPLAWLIGRRCFSQGGALLAAAAIAMPGWSGASHFVLAHTNLVETAVLATLLGCLRAVETPSAVRLALASLLLSLAINAHPTAIVAAPWLLWAFIARLRRHGLGLAWLPAAIAALLPWLPLLIDAAVHGWPLPTAAQHATASLTERVMQFPDVVLGMLGGWPVLVAGFLIPSFSPPVPLLAAAWYLLLLLGASGILWSARQRQTIAVALAVHCVAALALVCALRLAPPVYMFFAVIPLGCLAFAAGCTALLHGRWLFGCGVVLAILATAAQAATLAHRLQSMRQGTMTVPGEAFGDVRHDVGDDPFRRFWLAVSDQQAAAATLCGASPTAVHGELATALSMGAGVAVAMQCGAQADVRLGGQAATRHVAGLPLAHAELLGIVPSRTVVGWAIVDKPDVLHPPAARRSVVDPVYAPMRYRQAARDGPIAIARIDSACSPGDLLVVNNLMPGLNAFDATVTLAGERIEPSVRTVSALYFACERDASVRIELQSLDLRDADVFALRHAVR